MSQTGGNTPEDVAVWQIDPETGEVTDSDYYTNWD